MLEEECQLGRFRHDLFERIRGFTLELPPLRERKSDIPLLVNHFLEEDFNQKEMKAPSGALDELFRYDWPGNVRELRLSVKKAAIYADDDGNISALTLQNAVRTRVKVKHQNWIEFDPTSDTWETVEARAAETYFRSILAEANGKAEVAIKISGLKKSTYYDKLDKIGLKHRA
jgi:DNA-binding NtrC family response regulator